MKVHFDILRATRNNILNQIEGFSLEQLNKIPEGFNNNLIWNAAHVWITQQRLMYGLSGLKLNASNEMVKKYSKGSRPTNPVSSDEVDQIKKALMESISQGEKDYADGLFVEFKEYETSYGFGIRSIQDAIIFNNAHEGLHLGSILAIRKLV